MLKCAVLSAEQGDLFHQAENPEFLAVNRLKMVLCCDYSRTPEPGFGTAVAGDNKIIVQLIPVVRFPPAQSDITQQ